MRLALLFLFISALTFSSSAQKVQGVKNPGSKKSKKCAVCTDFLKTKPKEAVFKLDITDSNTVVFEFTDRDWFPVFFRTKKDGIAVDLITKDQFACDSKKNKLGVSGINEGIMLRPVYRDELYERVIDRTETGFRIDVGKVPPHLQGREIEPRLILISKGYACHAEFYHDIPSYRWEILKMGMLADELVHRDSLNSAFWAQDSSVLDRWHMRFVYQFEKAKFDYSSEDLKPLYDSLNLSMFDITKILLQAYSSVDGPTEKNIMLQEKRANNIIKVLQDYQTYEFEKEVRAEENWTEFLRDVKKTKYAHLASLSKEAIKDSLTVDSIEFGLEPILSKHRKAVLDLVLKRKDTLNFFNPDRLLVQLKDAVRDSMPSKAQDVQNAFYNKIIKGEFKADYADKIEFPEKPAYVPMENSMAVFNFFTDRWTLRKTLNTLIKLNRRMPDNGKVKYNLCVARLLLWDQGKRDFDHRTFKEDIMHLYELKVDPKLVAKLMINYNILLSDYYFGIKHYELKDKSVKYIFSNYKSTNLNDYDALSLAKYLASYENIKWARTVLKSKVTREVVLEELIFYYINLSITNPTVARSGSFKPILERAYKMNSARLCKLFATRGKGGVTFQLLREEKLKKMYCELCEDQKL